MQYNFYTISALYLTFYAFHCIFTFNLRKYMINKQFEIFVNKSILFMQENIDKPLTVDDIAHHVCCSNRHLSRAFHLVTGEGVFSTLLNIRIETAKDFFLKTDLNVSEVASHVGFADHSSFTRAFKQKTGM